MWLGLVVAQSVKNPPAMRETWVRSLGWEGPLEEGMAPHSSTLTWKIPMVRGAWWATVHGCCKELDIIERLGTAQHKIIWLGLVNEISFTSFNNFAYLKYKSLLFLKNVTSHHYTILPILILSNTHLMFKFPIAS